MHSLLYGLDLSKMEALLFTHSHSDHCYPEDLEFLREPYSHTRKGLLEVYGNTAVERRLLETGVSLGGEKERFRFHTIQPNDSFRVLGYRVLALRATHTKTEPCLFYHIEKDGKSLLYAHDTGAMSEENLEEYWKYGPVFHNGDYYRLASFAENHAYDAIMAVSKDKRVAVIDYVEVESRARSRAVRLELAGLRETTLYCSSLTGEVRSGAGWMYTGLLLPRLEWDYSSALIVLEAV